MNKNYLFRDRRNKNKLFSLVNKFYNKLKRIVAG